MELSARINEILASRPCCNLATVAVADLPERERSFFQSSRKGEWTAVALAHHITHRDEWRWYAVGADGERSPADDHLREVCRGIRDELQRAGYPAEIVAYPAESGLQFRYVAQSAGLGRIGVNAHLFHPAWGPWVHLRVMATPAPLDIRPAVSGDAFCNRCMRCVAECPAGAIAEDTFSGAACRAYRAAQGEYVPFGPDREYRYCLRCLLACPQGRRPEGFQRPCP